MSVQCYKVVFYKFQCYKGGSELDTIATYSIKNFQVSLSCLNHAKKVESRSLKSSSGLTRTLEKMMFL